MRYAAAVIAVAALALTGCSSAQPKETPTPEETATYSAVTTGPEGWDYCENLVAGMDSYVDFILDASQGQVNMTEYNTQETWAYTLEKQVPENGTDELADYLDPIQQMRDAVDSGGGNLSFNTDRFKTGAQTTLDYCVDEIGYKKTD